MKRNIIIAISLILITSCGAYAAKYKVNTSGTVKQNGQIVSPTKTTTTNYYNVYTPQSYIGSNQVNSGQVPVIELVMDYSGSMSNWIKEAKRAMSSIMAQIPSSTAVGFRVFGHNLHGSNPSNNATVAQVRKVVKKNGKYMAVTQNFIGNTTGYCSSTRQVAQVTRNNTASIQSGMNSVDIGGATPLVYGLDRAIYQDFANISRNTPKKVVLITDGGENCGGDPCAFAKQLMSNRQDVHIDVVLVGSSSSKLSCLATTTGGKFYTVKNLSNFSTVIQQSMTTPSSAVQQQNQQYYEFIK